MLGPGRYLLGVAEIAALLGLAVFGATALRARLLPRFEGAPALLATVVFALALLLWPAQLLGTVGLFEPVPYLLATAAAALLARRSARSSSGEKPSKTVGPRMGSLATLVALAIAAVALVKFGLVARPQLSAGMTGFDSTWYHGPFAAGFFQTGSTWDLHLIAPQFLAWFYPANSELFHAVGMGAFDRDILSPLLNVGWFAGCLLACWCIGRPHGVAPWSLALGAIALSVPGFTDQAGEARNDIVGAFFLLAAAGIAANAWAGRGRDAALGSGPVLAIGLAAGMAAGTKLNFLLPAAVLVIGLGALARSGVRLRTLALAVAAALAGGGYWYLRNFVHAGNPLPWIKELGPISLPAPDQALGGRDGHSVLSYLGDGVVWSDWFLPGLRDGLWAIWPLVLAIALVGLLASLGRRSGPMSRLLGVVGLATLVAWLIAPTSASGIPGEPLGFESGLRYLVPALALGFALAPTALRQSRPTDASTVRGRIDPKGSLRPLVAPAAVAIALVVIALGYPVQRHYLENRYTAPTFTTPGLNAAFAWSSSISDSRIATTSTRQYPLFGTELDNRVDYIGVERPHGGFVAPEDCRTWRALLTEGDYEYVVASYDRIEPGQPAFPPTAAWTEGPGATVVLREPPTVVFRLTAPPDPASCPAPPPTGR